MDEAGWLTNATPTHMVDWLGDRATDRKLRLFACAACRQIWWLLTDSRSRRAVEIAERFADGRANPDELYEAAQRASAASREAMALKRHGWNAAWAAAAAAGTPIELSRKAAMTISDADLVREVFGNPFKNPEFEPAWLSWNNGTAVNLARTIYQERRAELYPILADALEEAGCDRPDVLDHCRAPVRHVRGCWVVDAVLNLR